MAEEQPKGAAALRAAAGLALIGAAGWYFYGGGLEQRVADKAVAEYEIAARSGDPAAACAAAGLVAAAYLQAEDEPQYRAWKAKEAQHCGDLTRSAAP